MISVCSCFQRNFLGSTLQEVCVSQCLPLAVEQGADTPLPHLHYTPFKRPLPVPATT